MAEITIGGIGLVSLIGLFQTCHRAYDIFIRSARDLGRDAHLLAVNLEVERQKLRLWGQYLGISHRDRCQILRAQPFETQRLVVMLLDSIKERMDDVDVIMARYGVKIIEEGQNANESSEPMLHDLNLEDIRASSAVRSAQVRRTETERSITKSTSRFGKLRWALSDNPKLTKLADELCRINEGLWVALPRSQWIKLAMGLPSVVLPHISDQVSLDAVQGNARNNETTALLAACSDLRRTALISSTNASREDFAQNLNISAAQVDFKINFIAGDAGRVDTKRMDVVCVKQTDGTGIPALLEWRYVDRSFSDQEAQTIRSRIKALAVLLSSERQSQFGLLKCVGFYKDESHLAQTSIERYGLLFEHMAMPVLGPPSNISTTAFEQFRPHSLHEYINATASQPPYLGDRFRIATALCQTVLQIHASSWLHKAIQSSGVFFFPSTPTSTSSTAVTELDTSHPFLTGFDFSRPDVPAAHSLEVQDRTCHDYRHPSLWPVEGAGPSPRYQKRHDIYSLGVVLLEVGNWKLVGKLANRFRDPRNPLLWRDHLLECTKLLGYRCGKVYQEVVETCLLGRAVERGSSGDLLSNDEDQFAMRDSFLFDVVYKLGKCYA